MADGQNFQEERQVWSEPLDNPPAQNLLVLPEELGQVLPSGGQIVRSLAVSSQPQLGVGLLLLQVLGRHLARVQQELADLTLQPHLGDDRYQISGETADSVTAYFTPVIGLDS